MYRRKARSRVFTMPRWPSSPYMTVMVSMKTFTAREPDQRAIAKPRETSSGRLPWVTSSRSGLAMSWTPRSERTVPAARRMFSSMLATVSVFVQSSAYPRRAMRPRSSGGRDSSVKNAASAARPRIRYSMHELTVSLRSSQTIFRFETLR